MRQKVAAFLHGGSVESVPFFASCDNVTRQFIISALEPRIFLLSDNIVNQGEIGKDMFFIVKGNVAVLSLENAVTYYILGSGDYFGEACLVGATPRITTVNALSYCNCYVLKKKESIIQNIFSHSK